MSQIKDQMIPLFTSEDINQFIANIASAIEADYEGKEIIFICPLRGSVHFTADLMRKIDLPQQVDFVHIKAIERGGTIIVEKDLSIDITGKHVIIVEEIIDTGRTLSFLRNRLFASNPASLKIAALLDKPARRELPLKADYIGKTIEDRYVIGYGMDADELGRNYPDIYALKN